MLERLKPTAYLILFCTLLLISTSSGDTEGAALRMDQSLGDSIASFIGEDAGDRSGYCVAGIGDVNGDGYDDILIGAYGNSEGGSDSGQVYLIFGKTSGWSIDTDLSNANASFIGEEHGDIAGVFVAGAGDVNNDGFDDIVIGASYYDEFNYGGKVYLILGKASGWKMDTSLSMANASFLGENSRDRAGQCLAGVGDVNGDGYDDILVAAHLNDEGGSDAGQTYLIFGKGSGWTTNTNLSNVDASFWGENVYDKAGKSIAGAGDVNGDGFDDFLIGTDENNDAGNKAGKTYLIFGKATGWSMDTNLSSADASFLGEKSGDRSGFAVSLAGDVNADGYDDIIIGAYMNSEHGVGCGQTYIVLGKASGWSINTSLSASSASYSGEDVQDYSGYSVAGAGDVNSDGYDDILVGAWGGDDRGSLSGQTYLILGKASGWSMDNVISDANASFLGEDYDDISSFSIAGAGDVNGDGYDDLIIGAYGDEEGGETAGQSYLVCFDYLPPKLLDDLTPTTATTGDWFIINRTIVDNLAILNVNIEYWYGKSQEHIHESANLTSGDKQNGTWALNITIPFNRTDSLHYIFHVNDSGLFSISSKEGMATVLDNDPPDINDITPSQATTGDEFTMKVRVTDNIKLMDVRLIYWFEDTGTMLNESMNAVSNDVWSLTLTIPHNTTDTLHYHFFAIDNSSNYAIMTTKEVKVLDNDDPSFGRDLTQGAGTTGDVIFFSIEVFDNVLLKNVSLTYSYGTYGSKYSTWSIDLVEGEDDLWAVAVTLIHTTMDCSYVFTAYDDSGNKASTSIKIINITDNDDPFIIDDLSDEIATTGDMYYARVYVRDNIGIDSVYSTEAWSLIDWDVNGNRLYEYGIHINSSYIGQILISVTIVDVSGNEVIFELAPRTVIDNDPPEISYRTPLDKAVKGLEINLTPEISDNIDLEEAFIIYRYGDGSSVNVSIINDVRLTIPRHIEGDLHFHIAAVDSAGNWNATDEFTLNLVNSPPMFDGPSTWNVTEEKDETLDLSPFLSDENDDVDKLAIESSDQIVVLAGTTLNVRHDIVIPDRRMVLNISDGEDQIQVNITIHVVNVNDIPQIIEIYPRNNTKIKEGNRVSLSVTTYDEEGDVVIITWKEGEKILGTSTPLEVELKPGKHILTVVVDDGIDQVEETITVTVLKQEESSSLIFFVTLIGILVIIALLIIIRKRM